MRVQRHLSFWLAISGAFMLPLVFASPASAAACGAYGGSSLFDGFYTSSDASIEGLSANIRTEAAGALCTSPPAGQINDSYTHVLVADNPGHGGGYAQIGYNQDATHTPNYYYEYNLNGTASQRVAAYWHPGVLTISSTHRYWVQWTTYLCPSGCFALNIDTTRVAQTPWNPYVTFSDPTSSPWGLQTTAETKFANTDVSGNNAGGHATVWGTVQGQSFDTNAYSTIPCNLTPITSSSRYGLNYTSNAGCGTWSTYTY